MLTGSGDTQAGVVYTGSTTKPNGTWTYKFRFRTNGSLVRDVDRHASSSRPRTHAETDRQADPDTHAEADRQTDPDTHAEADRQADTEADSQGDAEADSQGDAETDPQGRRHAEAVAQAPPEREARRLTGATAGEPSPADRHVGPSPTPSPTPDGAVRDRPRHERRPAWHGPDARPGRPAGRGRWDRPEPARRLAAHRRRRDGAVHAARPTGGDDDEWPGGLALATAAAAAAPAGSPQPGRGRSWLRS